jgi:hypothetical protein
MKIRRVLVSLIIPALAAGMMTPVAFAQTDAGIPSLSVRPMGTSETDPNGGQWFVADMNPGETKQLGTRLYNPADVAQTVKLYLADMTFNEQGSAEVSNVPSDVATWGVFEHAVVTLEPKQTVVENFTITVPTGVDPGDHVGAVVAEHSPQGAGNIRAIKRVAVRLYVTLPGDATQEFEIDGVSAPKDAWYFPRELAVDVRLRNTGHVRLEPTVRVDGASATGPDLLMSNSMESYTIKRSVPFWGGPVRLTVDAQTRTLGRPGPSRQMRVTVWVIPWHLFGMLLVAAALAFLVRMWLRKRGARMQALRADLRRIERLVTQNRPELAPVPASSDVHTALLEAIKQARRAGDHETAERLERELDNAIKAGRHVLEQT